MGLGGLLLGGVVSGIGKGMEMSALDARNTALENLRNQRQIEQEGRTETRTIASEDRAETRAVANDARDSITKERLLNVASQNKREEGETDFDYKARLARIAGDEERKTVSARGRVDAGLVKLRGDIDMKRDAVSIRLKDDIDSGKYTRTEVAADGEILGLNDNGDVYHTGVKARAPASAMANPKELAEARKEYDTAKRRWDRKQSGPEPKPEDYGALSSAENGSGNSSPTGKDSPSYSASDTSWSSPASKKNGAPKVVSQAQLREAASAAGKSVTEMRQWALQNGFRIQ